jgi:uncharacterized protein YndB with AHSA1/START domain
MSQTQSATTTTSPDFILTRVFDAPRSLVWAAFTEPERIKQWWGPKGFTVIASKMDFRPGGIYHYGLKAQNDAAMWGKLVYREIDAPKRMIFITSFSDEAAGITRHPMAANWPLETLSTLMFDEEPGGKTKLTLRWSPHNASDEERKMFDASHDNMRQGWGGTMDQLAAYLADATKA